MSAPSIKSHINNCTSFNVSQKVALTKTFRQITGGAILTPTAGVANLTDSTGGSVTTTLAAITAGASYAQADLTAIKNGLASLNARVNTLQANLKTAGILT